MEVIKFNNQLKYQNIPQFSLHQARRCLLDLLGVAAGGTVTECSKIIHRHAIQHYPAGELSSSLFFSHHAEPNDLRVNPPNDLRVNPIGAALANAMTIDSLDGHDGHKQTKGHVGCGVLPALCGFSQAHHQTSADEFLAGLVVGYEIGSRAGLALHRTVADYHTSGAWVALACAGLGARIMGLDDNKTKQALGIAEYYGPRSQMMRCIDHPTMVKDGSGWGAMAGVSAAYLAADGFTGAPAITMSDTAVSDIWSDLGEVWHMDNQYIKLYPVCRWAQPAVESVLALKRAHKFSHDEIEAIEIVTFHEAKCLHTAEPKNTEEAQYSLPFPVAAVLVYDTMGAAELSGEALRDPKILKLARMMKLSEDDVYNAAFPEKRIGHAIIRLTNGETFTSGPMEAAGDPEDRPSDAVISEKFHRLAAPVIGKERAQAIEQEVWNLGISQKSITPLMKLIAG